MLERRMREVAEEYGYEFRASDDGEAWMVECLFAGGRSQLVVGTTLAAHGQRMHVLYTLVGAWTPEVDLEELVRRHLTWGPAKVGILGEDLAVVYPFEPDRLAREDGRSAMEEAMKEVSVRGDELEEELFGTDEH